MSSALEAALEYARRFGPVWPQTPAKTGYAGTRGSADATRDEATVRRCWTSHPEAVPALLTGAISGVVVLDIDLKNGRHGLDSLELVGVTTHPITPTAHTPSGGLHLLFKYPGRFVRSSSDRIGPGLEVKGDGAWITLPPGPDRFWDPHLGLERPLALMPEWMVVSESDYQRHSTPQRHPAAYVSRYAEAALDSAVKAIVNAPAGSQRDTLNLECFSIGGLVAGGQISCSLALEALLWAARQMPTHDPRRPWRVRDLERIVRDALLDGQRHPRAISA
jgi:hypothetical protein